MDYFLIIARDSNTPVSASIRFSFDDNEAQQLVTQLLYRHDISLTTDIGKEHAATVIAHLRAMMLQMGVPELAAQQFAENYFVDAFAALIAGSVRNTLELPEHSHAMAATGPDVRHKVRLSGKPSDN